MKLLILGGTSFVGRHLTEAALAAGHAVTLFNRGRTAPGLFPDCESLTGDRDGDHAALRSGSWDAVVDVCGYFPRQVRAALKALKGRAGLYAFVSTVSVYRDFAAGGDERAPTHDPREEGDRLADYGALKAGCERAVESEWDGPSLIARPGLVAGPHDPTDRFTYWAARVPAGGTVLAPGDPGRPAQFIDGRDLGAWLTAAANEGRTGRYNLCAPAQRMEDVLVACAADAGWGAVWVDDEFLLARGLKPYADLPLWVPGRVRAFDASRAVAAGLRCRDASATAADTLRWHRERGAPPLKAGLSAQWESRLLAEWGARR